MAKESRRVVREAVGTRAWIRIDDGSSVRPCRVIDLSSKGVCIVVDAPRDVTDRFRLLLSRNAAPGRPCQVKWRKGSEIGAEFVGA